MDLEKDDEVYPMMQKSLQKRDELPLLPFELVLVPVSDRVATSRMSARLRAVIAIEM